MGGVEHAPRARRPCAPSRRGLRLGRVAALVARGARPVAAAGAATAGNATRTGPRAGADAGAAEPDAARRTSAWRRSASPATAPDDVQERRKSTAAKIIIGRDEIDRFGDSTLGDVLKRLPGVTIQGRPGRGGAIRLRGLGNGYTQILLDGERVPPGFSLDSLTPDQIERIEILRAPTAETGARAIAGTINIITRDGYSKRVNDVRLDRRRTRTAGSSRRRRGRATSATAPFIVNYSLSGFTYDRDNSSTTTTVDQRSTTARVTLAQIDDGAAARAAAAASTRTGAAPVARRRRHRLGDADADRLRHNRFRSRAPRHADAERRRDAGAVRPAEHRRRRTRQLAAAPQRRVEPSLRARRRGPNCASASARRALPVHSFRTEFTNGSVSRTLEDDERLARHDDHRAAASWSRRSSTSTAW